MTKKPVTGRILALLTAVLTMTVMCLPASAFAANGVTKDETVYVVTDSSGTQQDVIVSDHLINKGKVKTIEDKIVSAFKDFVSSYNSTVEASKKSTNTGS